MRIFTVILVAMLLIATMKDINAEDENYIEPEFIYNEKTGEVEEVYPANVKKSEVSKPEYIPIFYQVTVMLMPGERIYRVKAGDTLVSVSRRYVVSVDAIKRRNQIPTGTDAIFPSQDLIIPAKKFQTFQPYYRNKWQKNYNPYNPYPNGYHRRW